MENVTVTIPPEHSSDWYLWETGLNLLEAMDLNLAAAKQVMTLTGENLLENQPDRVQTIVRIARQDLNKAGIANAEAHHQYRAGASRESLDQITRLAVDVQEQAGRVPDHFERMTVRDDDPFPGRQEQASLVVESLRRIHEQAEQAIGLIQQRDVSRNTKTMLQAIVRQAVLAVELTGNAVRELTKLR